MARTCSPENGISNGENVRLHPWSQNHRKRESYENEAIHRRTESEFKNHRYPRGLNPGWMGQDHHRATTEKTFLKLKNVFKKIFIVFWQIEWKEIHTYPQSGKMFNCTDKGKKCVFIKKKYAIL